MHQEPSQSPRLSSSAQDEVTRALVTVPKSEVDAAGRKEPKRKQQNRRKGK